MHYTKLNILHENTRCRSDLDISEDVLLLWAVVVLHEWLLTAAVPQVQHQVTQQSAQRISHQLFQSSVVDPDPVAS